ncbi:MAG: presenilin family intramembrane aspartyl protease PSH [Methanolobus sp.]|uniref:presenilin family intramembrane aspartyl protease PSH n=1 Tax=Methanolobus sp. TaxID=1874737 RepID=UPI002731AF4E|nr:presenilin family intramembrane aspartyl protease PSH [Methanolobus sp.]MDP2216266.1 presenilin family intramembrane aspartyl protease PSH [Methanolobus sp.]
MSSENKSIQEYVPMLVMAGIILVVQVIALLLAAPMAANDMRAFEDPDSAANSILYIIFVLAFTFVLLMAIKRNMKWIIQLTILLAVGATMYYVFFALLSIANISSLTNNVISITVAAVLTILLYKFPEWYVINIIGLIIGAGASAIFGISLSILPVVVLLALLAIYDAIAVYKTKHMIDLAEGVMDLRLPILFVIPKHLKYSFIQDSFKKEEGQKREAFFMGLGDAIMPTILVVSANVFLVEKYGIELLAGFITIPAIAAMVGTIIGFIALSILVMKGKPQAGLPFLNGGVILGYIAGVLISGTPLY